LIWPPNSDSSQFAASGAHMPLGRIQHWRVDSTRCTEDSPGERGRSSMAQCLPSILPHSRGTTQTELSKHTQDSATDIQPYVYLMHGARGPDASAASRPPASHNRTPRAAQISSSCRCDCSTPIGARCWLFGTCSISLARPSRPCPCTHHGPHVPRHQVRPLGARGTPFPR
jgi:hypothetical protein